MNKCNCEGCKISRDHNRGYQPCHNGVVSPMRPTKEEDFQELIGIADDLRFFREGTDYHNDDEYRLDQYKKKYSL